MKTQEKNVSFELKKKRKLANWFDEWHIHIETSRMFIVFFESVVAAQNSTLDHLHRLAWIRFHRYLQQASINPNIVVLLGDFYSWTLVLWLALKWNLWLMFVFVISRQPLDLYKY